jgi:CRP/FNR family transcriptional regulator, nitrogen oxide reductase regulator
MPTTAAALFRQDIEHLQRVELFQGIVPDNLARIAQAARRRQISAETFLFHQGDPAEMIYVPVQGRLKLTQITPEGHEVILRYVGVGEMTGATAAFGETAYPASAEAMEETSVLGWDNEAMIILIGQYPRLGLNILRLLSVRLQEVQDRLREMSTERVEQRIARALVRLVSQLGRKTETGVLIDLALSRQDLANMTGTTLYTVSRVLSRWEEEGIIEAGREKVLIKHPPSLVVIAEDLPLTVMPPGASRKR